MGSVRTRWTLVGGVAVLAAGAGILVAGVPGGGDSFVLDAGTSTTATVQVPATPPPTEPTATSVEVGSAGPVPAEQASTTIEQVVATEPTLATELTVAPASTAALSPEPSLVPRAQVRIVLANGDGRFDLVGSNAARLTVAGYVAIDQEDVSLRPDVTTIYVRAGFEDEAAQLAIDLQTPGAAILPLPIEPISDNDANGDLVVVLGPDALR